jgi:hypothetical protein
MGHAGKEMSDLYDKIEEDVTFRRKWAEQCGFGFELPSAFVSGDVFGGAVDKD